MTLTECRRLLKHFNDLADGTIPRPSGHKDWADVVHNAKVRAAEMEQAIEHREKRYASEPDTKPKVEVKKSGSSSNRK